MVGHRGRTFVIVVTGEVFVRKDRLHPLLEDILLLHGLGARVVIAVGARELIDERDAAEVLQRLQPVST